MICKNNKNQFIPGGFLKSDLISGRFIAHFIPFLPLERHHVLLCIRDFLESQNKKATADLLNKIADRIQFTEIFSAYGCRGVEEKAALHTHSESATTRGEL
jgi:hypothetical protein